MLGVEDGDATPARRRSREEEEGDGGRGVVSVGVDGRRGGGADEVVLGCSVLRSQGDDDDWGGPSVERSTTRAAR